MRKKVISIDEGSWRTGAFVPASGIYGVEHQEHRLPSEVTLLKGEAFPRCEACESAVVFRLQRRLADPDVTSSFRIQLYQLPVVEEQRQRAS